MVHLRTTKVDRARGMSAVRDKPDADPTWRPPLLLTHLGRRSHWFTGSLCVILAENVFWKGMASFSLL